MAARSTLFRSEAVQTVAERHLGAAVLVRPMGATVFTLILCSAALLLIVAMCSVTYQRRVRVSGLLVPNGGFSRVEAPQRATVVRIWAREGQQVQVGDRLFTLSIDRATTESNGIAAQLRPFLDARRASLQEEIEHTAVTAQARAKSLELRARETAVQIMSVDRQIEQQRRRLLLSEQVVKRYNELLANYFVTQLQLNEKLMEQLEQEQKLSELDRTRGQLSRERAALMEEASDVRARAHRDQQQLSRTLASVQQESLENEARSEIVVRSLAGGTVGSLLVDVGQSVSPGQGLLSIFSASEGLRADLYAPSSAIGFIRTGGVVLLRYEAFPYQKFGQHLGVVEDVPSIAVRAKDLDARLGNALSGDSAFVVKVTLPSQTVAAYGTSIPLKPGIRVDASILLEKRRLYEWALEPLYSITGRL